MGKLSDKEKYDILCKQEEELRFEHFDNDDAWKLGKILVKKAKEDKLPIAIDIQINGYQVFRYGFAGTNGFNEIWLQRKINSVNMIHRSTLRIHYMKSVGQDDLFVDGHLDPDEYSMMSGGFPIYVNGVGVVGVLSVSGLEHHEDHNTAVYGICKFLGKEVKLIHAES